MDSITYITDQLEQLGFHVYNLAVPDANLCIFSIRKGRIWQNMTIRNGDNEDLFIERIVGLWEWNKEAANYGWLK